MITKKTKTLEKPISNKKHKDKFHKIEKKIDDLMLFLQKKLQFVDKLILSDFMQKILSSKFIHNTNKSIKDHMIITSKTIGWIIIVFGGIGLLTALFSLSAIGFIISYIGPWFIILFLLNLIYIIIGILLGFGLVKMKKWVPFFITLIILIDLAYMLISVVFSNLSSIPYPWIILFYIVFMLYILKNKDLFNK